MSEADTGNGNGKPGLAWPDHDTGPVPPAEYKSRPRDDELPTRKPLAPWDRVKLLLAIVALFLFFFWGAVSDNPIISARDAFWDTVRSKAWLIGLLMLEAIRQLHYVFCERDAGYHRFWKERIFGGVDRRFHLWINAFNRVFLRQSEPHTTQIVSKFCGVIRHGLLERSGVSRIMTCNCVHD